MIKLEEERKNIIELNISFGLRLGLELGLELGLLLKFTKNLGVVYKA